MASGNALVLVPILFGAVAVCWSPMLLSDRVRSLFDDWPTSHLAVNYPLAAAAVVLVHVVVFFAGAIPQGPGSIFVLQWAFLSTLLVPLVGWVSVVVGLPRVADVELPAGVWLPLGVGVVWYVVVVGVVFALLGFLLFVFSFPG